MKILSISGLFIFSFYYSFSQDVKIESVAKNGEINAIRGTVVAKPGISIANFAAVYGESTTGIGIVGVSSSHNGIYGYSTSSYGGVVGVNSNSGSGVWGVSSGTGKAGLFDGGLNGYGVVVTNGASGFGTSTPTSRLSVVQPNEIVTKIDTFPAIYAFSNTATSSLKGGILGTYNLNNYGVGVQGIGYNGINNQNLSTVFGYVSQDIGVYGSANSAGVLGTSLSGIGVWGSTKSSFSAGTTGNGNTYGVYGYSTPMAGIASPSIRYGVYGYASGATTNWAGYFSGNVQVTGSISKGSGTFKIDHPLDPENKYLSHSFVESPDMMNIYNGNIITDENGYAIVNLPTYFSALNKDFKYQLTTIGSFAQAMVSKEISNNQFEIRTTEGNVKLSWQITGVRKDAFAEAHRVIVEQEKEPELKGYYLHADELKKPKSKSIEQKTHLSTGPNVQNEARFIQSSNSNAGNVTSNTANEIGGAKIVIEIPKN
jgi:hypothetical protein